MAILFLGGLLVSGVSEGVVIPSIGYLLPTEADQTFLAEEVTVSVGLAPASLSIDRSFLAETVQITANLGEISIFSINRAYVVGPVTVSVGANTAIPFVDRAYLANEVTVLVQVSGGFSEVFEDFEVISLKGGLEPTRNLDGEIETARSLRGEL